MSGFHPNRPVTEMGRLVPIRIEEIERRILSWTLRSPVGLVVPVCPDELGQPALARTIADLAHVPYLDTLLISLADATAGDYARSRECLACYPGRKVVLWNDSPGARDLIRQLAAAGLFTGAPGKARARWLAVGYLLAEHRVDYIAFHDAGLGPCSREMLARLVLPAADATLGFDFIKGFCTSPSNPLTGRVGRLLLAPLIAALARLIGDAPYLRDLGSFRCALAGDSVVKCDLAQRMRLPCDGALELGALLEALRYREPSRICQVDLAGGWHHPPQDAWPRDAGDELPSMAEQVSKHLLRTLAAGGVNLTDGALRSLVAAYQREAEDAVDDSYAVASVNGLHLDRHEEERTVQRFIAALVSSVAEFLLDPLGPPLLPNWHRVRAGVPDVGTALLAAAEHGAVVSGFQSRPARVSRRAMASPLQLVERLDLPATPV
jgi:glucosyl-3-phosphoglycerate synthase